MKKLILILTSLTLFILASFTSLAQTSLPSSGLTAELGAGGMSGKFSTALRLGYRFNPYLTATSSITRGNLKRVTHFGIRSGEYTFDKAFITGNTLTELGLQLDAPIKGGGYFLGLSTGTQKFTVTAKSSQPNPNSGSSGYFLFDLLINSVRSTTIDHEVQNHGRLSTYSVRSGFYLNLKANRRLGFALQYTARRLGKLTTYQYKGTENRLTTRSIKNDFTLNTLGAEVFYQFTLPL